VSLVFTRWLITFLGRNRAASAGDGSTGTTSTAGTALSPLAPGNARTRAGSVDLPKSKFLIGGVVPAVAARSGSAERRTRTPSAGTPSSGNSGSTTSAAGLRSTNGISPKSTNLRLPILALGRSDSMAQYTDVVDDEARLAEAARSSAALSAKAATPERPSRLDRTPKSQRKGAAGKGKSSDSPGGVPGVVLTNSPDGNLVVGMQRSTSADSDFGLLLYSEDDDHAQGEREPAYAAVGNVVLF
jgi:hypothetical protein